MEINISSDTMGRVGSPKRCYTRFIPSNLLFQGRARAHRQPIMGDKADGQVSPVDQYTNSQSDRDGDPCKEDKCMVNEQCHIAPSTDANLSSIIPSDIAVLDNAQPISVTTEPSATQIRTMHHGNRWQSPYRRVNRRSAMDESYNKSQRQPRRQNS
jgi:hypothetical protein